MPEGMEPMQAIETALHRIARRRRIFLILQGIATGLLWASCLTFALLALHKLAPIPTPPVLGYAALFVLLATLGGLWKGLQRIPIATLAGWVDEKLSLQERLSAAWELHERGVTNEWGTLVSRDAAKHVGSIHPEKLIPLQPPRSLFWAAMIGILVFALTFVPPFRSAAFREKEKERAIVSETAKRLVEVTRQQLEQRRPALQTTQSAIHEALEFGEQLTSAKLTRDDAIKDLASLSQKLQQESKELGDRPGVRSLEQAAKPSASAPGKGATDFQQRTKALQEALGAAEGKEQVLDKLKHDLEAAQKAAQQLPAGGTPEAAEARQNLAKALQQAAREAAQAGIPVEGLNEAIAALEQAQADFFLRDIHSALSAVDKLRDLAQSLQQLRQEQAKEAKTLPEQLQLGQAEAAKQRLNQMIQQLKAGTLRSDQRQAMIEELEKAILPANKYEKLPTFLNKALQHLRTGKASEQEPAANQLAEAAKALEQLQQEAADAEQLAEMADILKEAEAALAQGRAFNETRTVRKPRAGHGGKAGRGVGTWAHEGNSGAPESSEGWDNSDLTQPTLDPRSMADETDPQKNPNLMPARVKGQISPGGSMPSITLKGVHIKGQSAVRFTEAAATAQSDAQKALNQDKVPRAYQDSVKTYFDDFK